MKSKLCTQQSTLQLHIAENLGREEGGTKGREEGRGGRKKGEGGEEEERGGGREGREGSKREEEEGEEGGKRERKGRKDIVSCYKCMHMNPC